MIIFGSEDASGLCNDLFIFNSLNNYWKKLISTNSGPKVSKGSCIVLLFPYAYIYGGITRYGTTGEFWKFDLVSLEYVQLPSFLKRAFMKCNISNGLFYALEGIDNYGISKPGYSIYNLTSASWEHFSFNYVSYSNGLIVMLNNTLIKIGGQIMETEVTSEVLVISSNKSIHSYDLNYPKVYYSAFAHYKDRIYSLGGGSVQGNYPLPLTPIYDFFLHRFKRDMLRRCVRAFML